jgi:RNA polymerase sigma-70 factor (ECF subfamily)
VKDLTASSDTQQSLEERVFALLAKGDQRGAATEALRALGPDMLRYLVGLFEVRADAEECFSAASKRLWEKLPQFRGEASLKTWALKLASSAALDLRKSPWRSRGQRLQTDEAAELAASVRTASWLHDERLRLTLDQLRAALGLADQSLLQLRIDQELSWAQCAEVLSTDDARLSVDAVMKRFERIKARLRELAESRDGP